MLATTLVWPGTGAGGTGICDWSRRQPSFLVWNPSLSVWNPSFSVWNPSVLVWNLSLLVWNTGNPPEICPEIGHFWGGDASVLTTRCVKNDEFCDINDEFCIINENCCIIDGDCQRAHHEVWARHENRSYWPRKRYMQSAFTLKTMDFILNTMDLTLKTMDLMLKTMIFILKPMIFIQKWMKSLPKTKILY